MPETEKQGAALQPAPFNNPQMESAQVLQGAAAAAADSYYITKIALLRSLKECEKDSIGIAHWIDYALETTSRNLPIMRRKAKDAASNFTALEHSLTQAYNLQETWEKVNTVSREQMERLPPNDSAYNLSPDRLAILITGWEKMLSNSKSCFHGYRKQDPISAAELNLQFLRKLPGSLNASFQEILESTHNK